MDQFDIVLSQFEPMITSVMNRCRIYRNHEQYRQAARIGLWHAWTKYDHGRGDFAPYAYRCIQGAVLDELKKEMRNEERSVPSESDILEVLTTNQHVEKPDTHILDDILEELPPKDLQLLILVYIEGYTLEELADMEGITKGGIKKRKDRIMRKIREKKMLKGKRIK
ncbi:sigma-70 family RNA polymerase sigma factor [Viridibacillus sp. YIM B01967]|uniref:Sigma-70 family RNA polymerase sigma factor n=1 Tax=Viridibacillus soli TaxID=2798301 RepID=A0ABS1H5Y1_9BACL|nr:sigma-70 family RNA polymerase sigma factor [Viridibacillus soli]MBK3494806.1 sigma-70 family RNA polymerase sigma factor [Viridibacillus soli]